MIVVVSFVDPNKLFSLPPPEAENDKRDNENEGKLRDQFLKPSEPASGEQAQLDVPRAKSIPFGGSSCLVSGDQLSFISEKFSPNGL